MIITQLPAGLQPNDTSAEMYSHEGTLMTLTGGITVRAIEVDYVRNPVLAHMLARPAAHKKMQEWVGNDIDDQINQYGQCLWGAFNGVPDLDSEGNLSDPEFIQCSQKGMCPFEKDVCGCFSLNGLSKAEERIVPYVLWADRIIAETFHVSAFTITTQIRSIKNKINVETKAEVVSWAKDNGIKLCK